MGGERVVSLIRRRNILGVSSQSDFMKIVPNVFTLSTQINGSADEHGITYKFVAASNSPHYLSNDRIFYRYAPLYENGKTIVSNYIAQYSQSGYISRVLCNLDCALNSETERIRFTCAYNSTTGKTVSLSTVDSFFGVYNRENVYAPFTLKSTVSGQGELVFDSGGATFSALSGLIPLGGNKQIIRSKNADSDGNIPNCNISEYDQNQNFLARNSLSDFLTTGNNCAFVRVSLQYPSSLGLAMSETVLNNCFDVAIEK